MITLMTFFMIAAAIRVMVWIVRLCGNVVGTIIGLIFGALLLPIALLVGVGSLFIPIAIVLLGVNVIGRLLFPGSFAYRRIIR